MSHEAAHGTTCLKRSKQLALDAVNSTRHFVTSSALRLCQDWVPFVSHLWTSAPRDGIVLGHGILLLKDTDSGAMNGMDTSATLESIAEDGRLVTVVSNAHSWPRVPCTAGSGPRCQSHEPSSQAEGGKAAESVRS